MSKEKIFKTIYDASVLIGISSGFGYFVNLYDPSTSVIDYLKWVVILSGSIYLKDYVQREEILKRIDSLNSKKGAIASKEKTPKNLDLKLKRIINLANPVGDRDAVNKSYADAVNKSYADAKVKTLVNSLVSKTGDKMTGDLDMSGNEIINLGTPQNSKDAVNKEYSDKKVSKAGDAMTGDLNMSGNEIKNLKEASSSDATFAANVNYVNKTVSNSNAIIQTQWQDHVSERFDYAVDKEMENDFKYVLEGNRGDEFVDELDIKGMGVITSKDFHPINKRTAHFDLKFKKDYFKSSFAVNLRYAPKSLKYTIVCEMFWDDSVTSSIESATLKASSSNSSEVIFAQQSNVFENHVRTLVRTQRIFSWNPDKLVFDIVIKYRSGVAYPQKLPVYIVFYGSKGFYNNIPTSVWNSWRVFDQGNVSMQKNLILYQDPAVDKGAATKKYVDDNLKNTELQMRKIWYRGFLAHNNEKQVKFYANGTSGFTQNVKQSENGDFTVKTTDVTKLFFNTEGIYSISLIESIRTTSNIGTVMFALDPLPGVSILGNLNIALPLTNNAYKTYNLTSVLYIASGTSLKISSTALMDGIGSGSKKYGQLIVVKMD